MTYTCTRDFSTQGRDFTIGDKINRTEYIALTAIERENFKPDIVFRKADWIKVPNAMDDVISSCIRDVRDTQETIYKELLESHGIDMRNPEHLERLSVADHPNFIILNLDGETILSMDRMPEIDFKDGTYSATITYRANFKQDFVPLKEKKADVSTTRVHVKGVCCGH